MVVLSSSTPFLINLPHTHLFKTYLQFDKIYLIMLAHRLDNKKAKKIYYVKKKRNVTLRF